MQPLLCKSKNSVITMVLGVEHFSRICRACLCESNNLKPLFTKLVNGEQSLLSLFNLAANLSATMEDALPKQVCSECEMVLHRTEEFRNRCIASDKLLKNLIKGPSQDQYFDTISESYTNDVDTQLDVDKSLKFEVEVEDDKKNAIEFSHLNPECSEKLLENNAADIKMETSDSEKDFETDFTSNEPLETIELKEEEKPPENTTNLTKSWKNKKKTKDTQFSYITYQFSCKKCNIPFEDLTAWENHIKNHPINKNDSKPDDKGIFHCSLCFRRCKTKKTLTKHMKLHEETDNIKYSCDKCKREFKYKSFLESHVISVHMHNNFTCHLCNDKFDSKDNLEAHIDSHTEKKKHPCNICGKAFTMLCTLKDHMRKHTGEKPFLCSTCGKGFSQKTNLAQHTRRHLGVKPFKCNICSKGFVSKGELDAHNRKHSGAHPFVCDECGNGFTTSSALVKHRRTHTGERPYPCDLCSMRFAASGTLKNHRRTHTGERPFQCSLCDKAFVQRTDLMGHIRCHTGERPYICSQCGQAFRKAAALKNHLKMHGKEIGIMPGVNVLLNMNAS